ncbi:hypothetical protein D9757_001389 [Collybiopsis confluens]|uniref:Uncharacterized protein n=1 Tax=Collybiopsis confluens TaxID=2823264 RepID=A0A8H5MFQ8_9AGAR|nr:hypothetical protein D9757_001389 [Collybiopsis confluens]
MSTTSTDREVLVDVGNDFVVKVARVVFGALFYGIYLILTYFLVVLFIRRARNPKTKPPIYLVLVTIILFLGSTAFLSFDIADLVARMNIILIHHPDEAYQAKLDEADDRLKRLVWTGEILFIFMLPLGDTVVFWRTLALFQENKKIMIIPFVTLFGSIVAALYELGCDLKTHWAINSLTPSAGSVGALSCSHADLSSYTLSFATNIICTCLIVFRAWEHRKFMNQYLEKSRRRSPAERVLTLLIESGGVYLLLYILQSVPIYDKTLSEPASIAFNIINAIIQQGMGMYPTAIIVIVQMQRTFWADSEDGDSRQTNNSKPGMLFAPRAQSTTLGTTTGTATDFEPGLYSAIARDDTNVSKKAT